MRYDPTSLKWAITSKSDEKIVAAFDTEQAATAYLQTLAERDPSGRDDLQVYDLENDRPVEARELEQAGDRIG